MARRAKNQARRNGQSGPPGWLWLAIGVFAGGALAVGLALSGKLGGVERLLPQPNPQAQAPVASEEPVAQDVAEPKKPKYEFYDVLREKEVVIPDAELSAEAQREAAAAAAAADAASTAEAPPPDAEGPRYLIQAGAFRNAGDAEALKARIALTGEIARVEVADIGGAPIYRVRMGPYPTAGSLAAAKQTLAGNGIEAQAIRAQ